MPLAAREPPFIFQPFAVGLKMIRNTRICPATI